MGTRKMRVLSVLAVGLSLLCLAGCQEGSSRDKAIDLALNTIVEGALKSGTVVYYKFSVKDDEVYEFKVRESIPLRMTILDGAGKVVDVYSQDGKAYWDGMTFDPAGQYFLRLEAPKDYEVEYPAYGDDETAAYELMLTQKISIDDVPPEEFEALTKGVEVKDKVLDFFESKHYYRLTIPATVNNKTITYRVNTMVQGSGSVSTMVYSSDYGYASSTLYSAATEKTYYVVVSKSEMYDPYDKVRYNISFSESSSSSYDDDSYDDDSYDDDYWYYEGESYY